MPASASLYYTIIDLSWQIRSRVNLELLLLKLKTKRIWEREHGTPTSASDVLSVSTNTTSVMP
ncbi:MAG: hypothetical protein L6435_15915 [Anaerolineae bacterium]|nr:hypothetical protein [Anaerolineae bacterium]